MPQASISKSYEIISYNDRWVVDDTNKPGLHSSFDVATTPIIGRDGTSLQDLWEPYPSAYLSLCVPKMPNFFLFLGPNGGPGAGSFIAMLELVVDYVIKCTRKMQLEHITSMEVACVLYPF